MESAELSKARQKAGAGDTKGAVKALWRVEASARTNIEEARGLLELASALRERTEGRLQKDCDLLVEYARAYAQRGSTPRADALGVVRDCKVLAGSGLDVPPGSACDLIFRDDGVLLQMHRPGADPIAIPWEGLDIDIAGAGEVRKGTRWFGGGFGLEGAVEGALLATALNALTSRRVVDTIVRLQTPSAELFLHHNLMTPTALRMHLSPVFTRLRGQSQPVPSPSGRDAVEQLQRLADLLDRGLLTDDEFAHLKANLLGKTSGARQGDS